MSRIRVTEEKGIVYVRLNRPDTRNALDPEMIDDLTKAFRKYGERGLALVLQGEGKSFCAGADLTYMKSMVQFSAEKNEEDARHLQEMFQALWDVRVPVIVIAHGHVFGGALGLLACGDIVLVESGTKFCFSEVKLGIAPAVIAPFVCQKIGVNKATQVMLTGTVFSSFEAERLGLAHFHGSEPELESELERRLGELEQAGPESVKATKTLLRLCASQSIQEAHRESVKLIARLRVSTEGQEGMSAFLEKRKPRWKTSNA